MVELSNLNIPVCEVIDLIDNLSNNLQKPSDQKKESQNSHPKKRRV
jgi:hypothetical protein